MAKEKMVSILVHTPFTLTFSDGEKRQFAKGFHDVALSVAEHWFTKEHAEITDKSVVSIDDLQPLVEDLQKQLAEKETFIEELKGALAQAKVLNDGLQNQLDELSLVGGENTDGKKSKSTDSK
ncbi:STY1053 family phage-associated protein [Hafnia paralvei]|uniref:STY1053 family phage-associated protein n=1 Tax=Hafnia paralvei TaxID=546367 RepID=UPI0039AF7A14